MKRILIFSLILAFIFGLNVPSRGIFVSPAEAAKPSQNLSQINSQQSSVQVVLPQPTQTIVIVRSALPLLANCQYGAADSGTLLQDTGVINLNQPANCFTLQLAKQALPLARLSVLPLNLNTQKIVVVNAGPSWSSPDLATDKPVSSMPLLPLTIFVLALSYGFLERKLIVKTLRYRRSDFIGNLSLAQLQILRC